MIRITVYSGNSETDQRKGTISAYIVGDSEVSEHLRQIGLEWKQADYMTQRQVVITLDPIGVQEEEDLVKAVLQTAMDKLGEFLGRSQKPVG